MLPSTTDTSGEVAPRLTEVPTMYSDLATGGKLKYSKGAMQPLCMLGMQKSWIISI